MALEHLLEKYRAFSRGYNLDRHATVFPRILLGPACYLSPIFMDLHDITHIVNCANDEVCSSWAKRKVGKNYKCINAIDHSQYMILNECYEEFSKTMDEYLRDPQCKNIYVHCQAGMNRSACLLLAYIHKRFRVSLDVLIHSVARQRPCILRNTGFQKQLLEFK